ncbi:MAG TPA: hypothetical protein VNE58_00260 [Casimicrobiaceae bacterium]|nr:hypothetical protein [Casimicrobiaceae bacterium]
MHRRRLRYPAWFAVFALLFAQLATAAYACPQINGASIVAAATDARTSPCLESMSDDDGRSPLCFEHCKTGQQLVDSPTPANVPMAPPVLALVVTALDVALLPHAGPIDRLLAHATAPPVFASSARLRI